MEINSKEYTMTRNIEKKYGAQIPQPKKVSDKVAPSDTKKSEKPSAAGHSQDADRHAKHRHTDKKDN